MNKESRNQSVVGCTDGVPLFKDKVRGAWPVVFRDGNLPSALGNLMRNCHIVSIQGSEFISLNEETNMMEKIVRAPKSLNPIMEIVGRVMHRLYHTGCRIIDTSEPVDSPDRVFTCRLVMLFWCGDYPGQALISGFTHKGYHFCHWCHSMGWWDGTTNRMIIDDFRRDLGNIRMLVLFYISRLVCDHKSTFAVHKSTYVNLKSTYYV